MLLSKKDRWEKVTESKYGIVSFACILVICLVYIARIDADLEIGDTDYYCNIANGVIHDGCIDLRMYPETFRGYFFPIFLQVLKISPVGISFGWKVVTSLMIALLFSCIVPTIMGINVDSWKKVIGTLVSVLLYLFFWSDTLVYPLSDLPALFNMLCGVYILLRLMNNEQHLKKVAIESAFFGGGGLCNI